MNSILNLVIASLMITPTGICGTTTTGVSFSQETVSTSTDVFKLNGKILYYIIDGEIVNLK